MLGVSTIHNEFPSINLHTHAKMLQDVPENYLKAPNISYIPKPPTIQFLIACGIWVCGILLMYLEMYT